MKYEILSNSTKNALTILKALSENDLDEAQLKNILTNENNGKKQNFSEIIEKLTSCGFIINKNKNSKYSLAVKNHILNISKEEIKHFSNIKRLIYAQKQPKSVKQLMKICHKIANLIENEEIKNEILYFDYFSTINWYLVRILERHCLNKDVILIDYILPQGGNKLIEIHTDSISMGESNNRIYLNGILKGGYQFSHLPVDRIFKVEKVIRSTKPIRQLSSGLKFIISKEEYEKTTLQKGEYLVDLDENYATIKCAIVDELLLTQRLLSFCPNLYYISDEKIKLKLKEKLETLKANYEEQIDK